MKASEKRRTSTFFQSMLIAMQLKLSRAYFFKIEYAKKRDILSEKRDGAKKV